MSKEGKTSLKELRKLEKEMKKEWVRERISISLNICPVCSSHIVRQDEEILEKPKSYLFGLIKVKERIWDVRQICSKDKSHYENAYYKNRGCF